MYHKTFTNAFRLITLLAVLVGLLVVPVVVLADHHPSCPSLLITDPLYVTLGCGVAHSTRTSTSSSSSTSNTPVETPLHKKLDIDSDGDGTNNFFDSCPFHAGGHEDTNGICRDDYVERLNGAADIVVFKDNTSHDLRFYAGDSSGELGNGIPAKFIALLLAAGKNFQLVLDTPTKGLSLANHGNGLFSVLYVDRTSDESRFARFLISADCYKDELVPKNVRDAQAALVAAEAARDTPAAAQNRHQAAADHVAAGVAAAAAEIAAARANRDNVQAERDDAFRQLGLLQQEVVAAIDGGFAAAIAVARAEFEKARDNLAEDDARIDAANEDVAKANANLEKQSALQIIHAEEAFEAATASEKQDLAAALAPFGIVEFALF